MPKPAYEVAVVGAGPAGSRAARNLAAAGFKVALLEEHRRIGVPSHCSGLISPRTLREAEIGGEAVLHRLTGAYLHTASGLEVALGGSKVRAVAIDRVAWDETLCEQAQRAGAELIHSRLLHAEREEGLVRLHSQRNGVTSTTTARLVIGADGAYSRVGRSLGLAGPSEKVHCLGIEGRLRVPREDFVHVFVGGELAPGWFGWIIPVGGGIVRLGIGCLGPEKPVRCYARLRETFPRLLGELEPIRMYGGTIPLTFAPRSYGDNALLAGDAAGQVKPFSGGGIYTGLVAARHAAFAAGAALTKDDVSAGALSGYERSWKKEIGRDLLRSLRLRRFGLSLSDAEAGMLVELLRSPHLQALADRHGDIDFPARALLPLARSLPALRVLARLGLRRPLVAWNLLLAHLPAL